MAERDNRKRLTGVDVLVVAALGLVLVLLVPVLFAKPRARATRVLCGANLSQIGKAMFVYANDYEGALPRAGGRNSMWGKVANFAAPDRYTAYCVNRITGDGGRASISSCFYLLVKYCEMPPRLFICRGDKGATEFKVSELVKVGIVPRATEFSDLWDFGAHHSRTDYPGAHCSYAYHAPFGLYSLTTSRDPNLAVAADRNPRIASPAADPMPFASFMPDLPLQGFYGSVRQARVGNAVTHEQDGQNVLFLDGRVTFERRAFCGVRKDNIYTLSTRGPDRGDPRGMPPTAASQAVSVEDSLLIHDDPTLR